MRFRSVSFVLISLVVLSNALDIPLLDGLLGIDNTCVKANCTFNANGTSSMCCSTETCADHDIYRSRFSLSKYQCESCSAVGGYCADTPCCDGTFCNSEPTYMFSQRTGTKNVCRKCVGEGQTIHGSTYNIPYTTTNQCCFGLTQLKNDNGANLPAVCRKAEANESCSANSCTGQDSSIYCFNPTPYPHLVNGSDLNERGSCVQCAPVNTSCSGVGPTGCCDNNICQSPTDGSTANAICRCSRTDLDFCIGSTHSASSCCDKTSAYCTNQQGLKAVNGGSGICQGCRQLAESCYSGDGGVPCCGADQHTALCAVSATNTAPVADYVQGVCVAVSPAGCAAQGSACVGATHTESTCCDQTKNFCSAPDGLITVNYNNGTCLGCRAVGESCYSGSGGVPCCGGDATLCAGTDGNPAPDYVKGTCVNLST